MSPEEDLLSWIAVRQRPAELAILNGDPAPRSATWSHQDPVTLFGAIYTVSGWADVSRTFRHLAQRFSDCTAYEYEVAAAVAGEGTAYTVGYERTSVSVDGEPRSFVLRVTHGYRRERGDWRIAHRHADELLTQPLPE